MHLRALVAPLVLCTGCTIIFDADDLRHRDAQPGIDAERMPDAEVPDAIPFDANPSLLEITGASPAEIDEGVGGEGGRPAMISILGSDIAGDAVVSASFVEASIADPVILETGRAPSGHSIVVAMQIPVLGDLDAGETRTLHLVVSQNGGATEMGIDVIVNGLDELTLTAGNVAGNSLDAKYSHIDVTGDVHFTGTTPVRLVATGDIAISAIVDVDGAGQGAGVQGCAGGAAAMRGGCDGGFPGANNALGTGAGGGGGGYGTKGDNGANSTATLLGGAGGNTSGNDMLIPFVTAGSGPGNRGAGGGGGGNPALNLGTGGIGGGGGGVISVEAGGDIVITGTGAIRSKGGAGSVVNGSGGGGGAGGAILVRAGGTITSSAWLSADGGPGGDGTNDGGAGGDGRIRVDTADGNVPAMGTTPEPLRGPAWDDSVPAIVRTATQTFEIHGPPGRKLGVTLDGDALEPLADFTIGTNGTKTLDAEDVDLPLGVHELCVAYAAFDTNPSISLPEALTCVTVAYFP